MNSSFTGRVGIAIAAHNSAKVLGRCIEELGNEPWLIVLFDDGSRDGTGETARSIRSDVRIVQGDGNAWWAGGTARAVDECFSLGCEYVLMLNPDAYISGQDVSRLVDYAAGHPDTIPAGLVVADGDEETVVWAGSRRIRVWGFPIYTSRYIAKRGARAVELGTNAYETDEIHGRGVLVSRSVYERIGTLDWRVFPHYGADNDYSLRAQAAGIKMFILPQVRVRLTVEQSGMAIRTPRFSVGRLREVWDSLTKRKNGEQFRVLWHLHRRHVPYCAVIPSLLFNLALVTIRRMM